MGAPQPMETAPDDARLLVHFKGAGWIVAYRDPDMPEMWVRYLGYGKSTLWPTIHGDYATGWVNLPPLPEPFAPKSPQK
jgi:hypothetical protein